MNTSTKLFLLTLVCFSLTACKFLGIDWHKEKPAADASTELAEDEDETPMDGTQLLIGMTGLNIGAYEDQAAAQQEDAEQAHLAKLPEAELAEDYDPPPLEINRFDRMLKLQLLLDTGIELDEEIKARISKIDDYQRPNDPTLQTLGQELEQLYQISQTLQEDVLAALDDNEQEVYYMTETQLLNKEVMQIGKQLISIETDLQAYEESLKPSDSED
ncbi:MAG: hypothetical protein AAF512_24265 [Pseudomonadota bacterium]